MKLCPVAILSCLLFVLVPAISGQSLVNATDADTLVLPKSQPADSDAPILLTDEPTGPLPEIFPHQAAQPATPVVSQSQADPDDSRAMEDRYRTEIRLLAQKKHQFVHCKLKNGKVITGTVRSPGYEAFTLKTDVLGEGKHIYYKDLAEPPQAVVAVGTRFKQGAEWTGLGVLVAVGLPLLIVLSPLLYASGWRC